jgi:hypothetical protein
LRTDSKYFIEEYQPHPVCTGDADLKKFNLTKLFIQKRNFMEVNGSSVSETRGIEWIDLAQDSGGLRAIVNAVMNLRFPSNAGNFLIS